MPPENEFLLTEGIDPQSAASLKVPPGTYLTPPEPVVDTKIEHHYICTQPNASMHRKDGTRLGFTKGHFVTSMKADIAFLENEIGHGHPYIRHATPEEVKAAMMLKDPKGTIRAEIEADLRKELTDKIRKELLAEQGLSGEDADKDTADLNNDQLASIAAATSANASGQPPTVETVAAAKTDAVKLSGTSKLEQLREKARIRSGTATLVPRPTPIMESRPAPITPVSSADLGGIAGDPGNNGPVS